MCGINGILNKESQNPETLAHYVRVMNTLTRHRGPDDNGLWLGDDNKLAFGHTRLSIIDLSDYAHQPFCDDSGNVLVFNGEIYNYLELKAQLAGHWSFKTQSDTEVILAAYHHYGIDCIKHFEGMFAFALWDNKAKKLHLVRDRVGIKPLYYYVENQNVYFSSEVKALLPFIDNLQLNKEALSEYFIFQYPLHEDTLFSGIKQIMPGELLTIQHGKILRKSYWQINYNSNPIDEIHAAENFQSLMHDSIAKHLRSDVAIGSYLSGGIDSSLITLLAKQQSSNINYAINGRFTDDKKFDESDFASIVAQQANIELDIQTITAQDFINNINKIVYHLDYPIAGPGSFPQYMVSKKASDKFKVMLGGQGADELFGGYARYLLMAFGDMINNVIDNKIESANINKCSNILQQLGLLQQYKPLFEQFMRQDCFADHAKRYYNLINRSVDLNQEIDWHDLPMQQVYDRYENVFNAASNIMGKNVLNQVMYFDFKYSLPALLHVEDRVSMAHGVESRVPFLDHRIIEFAANLSPELKFGTSGMKGFLKNTFHDILPQQILNRKDKMGFPVPINNWSRTHLKEFIVDSLSASRSQSRPYINYQPLLKNLDSDQYSRKIWALLNLELWFQNFFDKHHYYKKLLHESEISNYELPQN